MQCDLTCHKCGKRLGKISFLMSVRGVKEDGCINSVTRDGEDYIAHFLCDECAKTDPWTGGQNETYD